MTDAAAFHRMVRYLIYDSNLPLDCVCHQIQKWWAKRNIPEWYKGIQRWIDEINSWRR